MGSGASRPFFSCLRPSAAGNGGDDLAAGGVAIFDPSPLDETLGHSFCYVRSTSPGPSAPPSPTAASGAGETAFKSISGASVSANSSAPVPIFDSSAAAARSAFRGSSSFSALPLQLSSSGGGAASGPLDRGFFLSGPIERGALSGPLDPVPFSGPIAKRTRSRIPGRIRIRKPSLLRRSLSEKNRPWVVPLRSNFPNPNPNPNPRRAASAADDDLHCGGREKVQWAHGKAGEDRVHVVVSEEHRWLFVGIYDGFNGPDAPEFLVDNLYKSVFNELKGLFWEEIEEGEEETNRRATFGEGRPLWELLEESEEDGRLEFSGSGRFAFSLSKLRNGLGSWRKEAGRMRFPRWRFDWDEKAKVVGQVPPENSGGQRKRRRKAGPVADHELVLNALSRALEVTEIAYLEMTDRAMECNPELALMGSCLLVAVMRDEDVYVMNVGDSRAIVAQYRSSEEGSADVGRGVGGDGGDVEIEAPNQEAIGLEALQLSTDHSTNIAEEVLRIREEHPDDNECIANGRVKGRLKVTRAFGAGFLKQPKWNNGLLEMFRNDYIGTAPYLSCLPSLCHHKLGPNDQFLVLSSDGLYQYLSNEEVVLHVVNFMERFPDGDPAQSLIEELLFRAAKKAGMDFHELLDIPQGDRRKYHDDVTVMVISLEGRIWKSSGKYV